MAAYHKSDEGGSSHCRSRTEVTLLEGDPSFSRLFAGEWLHPEGLRLLRKQGILLDELNSAVVTPSKGFVVFPDDGSEPICLENPRQRQGVAFDRALLMDLMRKRCEDHPRIQLLSHANVDRVERGRLSVQGGAFGTGGEILANRIIGADGRKSIVRRAHGAARRPHLISYMVGAVLRDVSLPFEGFGHVILGGPGPILVYRIGTDSVRVCMDVPQRLFRSSRDKVTALAGHLEALWPELRQALRRELETGAYAVRANQFRPRVFYGDDDMPLIGDAVGFHHPLTAMGMTLGFEDADCLVRSQDFQVFERERISRTFVPELLALALYEAFSRTDPGAASVRRAIYSMWRSYAVERERTMKLLCGEETNIIRFGQSFMRGAQLALVHSLLRGGSLVEIYRDTLGTLGSIGKILCLLTKPSSCRILPFRQGTNPALVGGRSSSAA